MTRGLAEMSRLGVALGAQPATFQGLAGVGDLAVTCFSPLSRNHRLGEMLAAGSSPEAALAAIGEAVEGAATAPVMVRLASEHGIDVPIAAEVSAVLSGRKSVREAMRDLLLRELTSEYRP
jgi:glycerol-3-phosphate dehydrogenase (NAD(P)+)